MVSPAALLTLIAMPVFAPEPPPPFIYVYRERLKPGVEAEYGKVEEDAAHICARLECPNPYLALESVRGPREVWWLNAFASETDRDRVYRGYEQNLALKAALQDITRRKQGLIFEPDETLATYRSDLSDGSSWRMLGARFFAMTVMDAARKADGCVFEAPNAKWFVVVPAATRSEADRKAATAGPGTKVFAIRPAWSLPAEAWIAADPDFWQASPAVTSRKRP
jgi:hypothetical protein